MIVVSDTSPIFNLSLIDRLNILESLYGKIFIPEAVFFELVGLESKINIRIPIQKIHWIETQAVIDHLLVNSFLTSLHRGESEGIVLALEMKSDILLMDEREGRRIASNFGLKSVGLLGVIIEAKYKGLITSVKPIIDELIVEAGFWISRNLYYHILQEVEE